MTNHINGTILICQQCDNEILGVWHTPELISEDGCFCIRCLKKKPTKKECEYKKNLILSKE